VVHASSASGSAMRETSASREAGGDQVALLDDGCHPAPDYLDNVVRVSTTHPNVGFVGGQVLLGDEVDAR